MSSRVPKNHVLLICTTAAELFCVTLTNFLILVALSSCRPDVILAIVELNTKCPCQLLLPVVCQRTATVIATIFMLIERLHFSQRKLFLYSLSKYEIEYICSTLAFLWFDCFKLQCWQSYIYGSNVCRNISKILRKSHCYLSTLIKFLISAIQS